MEATTKVADGDAAEVSCPSQRVTEVYSGCRRSINDRRCWRSYRWRCGLEFETVAFAVANAEVSTSTW